MVSEWQHRTQMRPSDVLTAAKNSTGDGNSILQHDYSVLLGVDVLPWRCGPVVSLHVSWVTVTGRLPLQPGSRLIARH